MSEAIITEYARCFILHRNQREPDYLFSLYNYNDINVVIRQPYNVQSNIDFVFIPIEEDDYTDRLLSGVQTSVVRELLSVANPFFITVKGERMDIVGQKEYVMYKLRAEEGDQVFSLFQGFFSSSLEELNNSEELAAKNSIIRANTANEAYKNVLKIQENLSECNDKIQFWSSLVIDRIIELDNNMKIVGENFELFNEFTRMLNILNILYDNGDLVNKYTAMLTDLTRAFNQEEDFKMSNYQ